MGRVRRFPRGLPAHSSLSRLESLPQPSQKDSAAVGRPIKAREGRLVAEGAVDTSVPSSGAKFSKKMWHNYMNAPPLGVSAPTMVPPISPVP